MDNRYSSDYTMPGKLVSNHIRTYTDETYMRDQSRISKSKRLFHINLFLKYHIQEDIINIKLIYPPTMRNNNNKYQPNRNWFNHRTKCF